MKSLSLLTPIIFKFWVHVGYSSIFHSAFSGIIWPLGLVDTGTKDFFAGTQKDELVSATFVNRIFLNFAGNDDVKSFFALWGRVEWAGAELNGIDTWECHI